MTIPTKDKSLMKNVSFDAKTETYVRFKSLLIGKNIKVQNKLNELMEEFIMKFDSSESNLDEFIKNPEFQITPAFFETPENWMKHLLLLNEKELQKIIWQCQTIGARSQKLKKYGTINVN